MVFSHFVICNDTQETLRFGQVDTDENVLLASLHRHQYSWRSHRSPQVCEERPAGTASVKAGGSLVLQLCPVSSYFSLWVGLPRTHVSHSGQEPRSVERWGTVLLGEDVLLGARAVEWHGGYEIECRRRFRSWPGVTLLYFPHISFLACNVGITVTISWDGEN